MKTFIETIHVAVALDATPEQKQAGAAACRAILTALEAESGQTLGALAPSTPRRLNVDQVLELVIARLQAMLPSEGAATAARSGLTIPMVTAPRRTP
jgi:hypothetical protein